jgi:3-hydroxyisobutyrate dehydrogenase
MSDQTRVAFLGLGAMGGRMATRIADAGHHLRVWSRSGVSRTTPALSRLAAATAEEAVRTADIAFSMVTDDEASRALWSGPRGALRAMRPGAILVECSTLTPGWVSELALRARDVGVEFVEAPVVGSRPHAGDGDLIFLAGGDAAVVHRARPVLARMGNAVHHVGPTPTAAYAKLIANALFGVQVAALAELLGFAAKAPLDLEALMRALDVLPMLSPSAKGAAAGMLARRFDPMFPLELAAKDVRYALAAAEAVGSVLPLVRGASEVLERGRVHGLASENLTAIAKLYE